MLQAVMGEQFSFFGVRFALVYVREEGTCTRSIGRPPAKTRLINGSE